MKTGIVLLIVLLEVGYLGYTTSQEYPKLDIEEMKANLRVKKALMAEEQSKIEQKEALWYLEKVLLDSTKCEEKRSRTGTITITATGPSSNLQIK